MFLASVLCLQSMADASLRRMLHRANRVRLGSVKVGLNSRKWCEMHVPGAMGLYFCGTPLCYRGVPLAARALREQCMADGACGWYALGAS